MRNKIFYTLHEDADEKLLGPIIPAPSQDMLSIFNGPLSIEKFREASIIFKKQYIQNAPLVRTIERHFEESNSSSNNNNAKARAKAKEYDLARPATMSAKGNVLAVSKTALLSS
jgi:hypothetical protein